MVSRTASLVIAAAGVVALAAFAAGCGSTYLPVRTAGVLGAARPGVEHGEATFDGARGIHLYEQWWRPRAAPPRAAVVIVHGLKDHGSRYDELATRLCARGFAVYAFDLRGHAHSEGERVWIESFDDYLDDLDIYLRRVAAREPQRPVFLFGHSMGGAIATLYTITHKPPAGPQLRGLITHAAALKVDASGVTVFGMRVVAATTPHAGIFQLDLEQFSRDPDVVGRAKTDPLVYQPSAPARTARELVGAIRRIDEHMEDVTLPLLALHGTADRVTPPAGSEELYRRARSGDKTLKLYPGLYHDLVHEPEKETVIADIIAWLEARTSTAN